MLSTNAFIYHLLIEKKIKNRLKAKIKALLLLIINFFISFWALASLYYFLIKLTKRLI